VTPDQLHVLMEVAKDVETSYVLWKVRILKHVPHQYAAQMLSWEPIAHVKSAHQVQAQTGVRDNVKDLLAQLGLVYKLMDNADQIIAHQDID